MQDNAGTFKLLVLGSADVGKTCLATRYVQDRFLDKPPNTIGACFLSKDIEIGNHTIPLHLWDTAGHERFRSMLPLYYRGAHAAVLVFDVTTKKSFDDLRIWVQELKRHLNQDIVLAIACNKVDLQPRAVEFSVAEQYANSIGALCFETSAKNSTGVNEMFNEIATRLFQKFGTQTSRPSVSPQPSYEQPIFPTHKVVLQRNQSSCCLSSKRR
eukprot:c4227_g1_i1.p1 GENE.c4227_g1_i1~~c4227_g1_i1.p1  ORF type:complete len:213 (+),score=42.22 c4227_g1_i1:29-667(+)